MVAWREDGQGYFDFEALDFQGALFEIGQEINHLIDYRSTKEFGSWFFEKADCRIEMLIKVSRYIECLKWGKRYVG